MKLIIAFLLTLFSITAFASDNNTTPMTKNNIQISDQLVEKLAAKKIYFGHQSVGKNIMNGIEDILTAEQKKKLNIIDSLDATNYEGSMFAHSRVGYNMDPISKIIGFNNYVNNLSDWQPNMAMFKFCYVDIKENADVKEIFSEYQSRMSKLKTAYPDIQFVHFTVPLTTVETGLKADFMKNVLGKTQGRERDNVKRNQYNDLLRQTYSGKEPVFDLAEIESTRENGARVVYTLNDNQYFSLAPEYASDGRHLNELGRQIVAKKLLEFLSQLPE